MHPLVKFIQELHMKYSQGQLRKENGNRKVWLKKLQDVYPDCQIEDLTDLNYSTSHEYWVWFPHEEENDPNERFALQILISMLAPCAVMKFLRRYDEVELDISSLPYCSEHAEYSKRAEKFFEQNQLEQLDDDTLQLLVPGVTLELQEDEASVYNCLFEDSAYQFPYKGY
ncbi:MAG: hypothetical protein ACXVPC_11210 [Tumebacillaceae bacterium]